MLHFPVSPLGSLGVSGNREETPTRQRHQNKSEPLGCGAGVVAAAIGAAEGTAPSIALGRSIHSDMDHSGALKRNSPLRGINFNCSKTSNVNDRHFAFVVTLFCLILIVQYVHLF